MNMHRSAKDPGPKRERRDGASIGVAWGEIPRIKGGGGLAPIVEELLAVLPTLKQRPGEWARIASFDVRSRSMNLRKKLLDHEWVAAGFELIANRSVTDPEGSTLFARYREETAHE